MRGLTQQWGAPCVACLPRACAPVSGENSLCYDGGNYAQGTGYACMQQALLTSWRRVWSAQTGTTSPLAPFGIASLADGTDEGFGVNMRSFRWVPDLGPRTRERRGGGGRFLNDHGWGFL